MLLPVLAHGLGLARVREGSAGSQASLRLIALATLSKLPLGKWDGRYMCTQVNDKIDNVGGGERTSSEQRV